MKKDDSIRDIFSFLFTSSLQLNEHLIKKNHIYLWIKHVDLYNNQYVPSLIKRLSPKSASSAVIYPSS